MHSKHDFFELSNSLSIFDSSGLAAVFTKEPYIEHYVIKQRRSESQDIFLFGADVTLDWLEENLFTLSFFGSDDNFIILQAELLSGECFNALVNTQDVAEHAVLLCFSRKSDYFIELKKSEEWQCATIEAPPFWKDGELLRFFCDKHDLYLEADAFNFILSSVPASIEEFANLTNQLAMIFSSSADKRVTLNEIKEIVSPFKMDQFELLSLLAQKQRIKFLQKIIALKPDDKMLEELFRMVCSHFIKLADTSYLQKKKRLTKYDRQIEAHAKLWKLSDIERVIDFFGRLQRMARMKEPEILNQLREVLLLSVGGKQKKPH